MHEEGFSVALDQRMDSNTVNGLQDQIEAWIEEDKPENILLDASELEYISSAGLRLLLRLQKRFSGMKVQNVSKEVNEIFEMTGFDQILTVEKALRKIPAQGLELIGEGGMGQVYRIDDDTIVKVYKSAPVETIKEQLDYSKKAFFKGIPTVISYDLVDVDGNYGVVFELIRSDTLANTLNKEPDRIDYWAGKYARLMKTVASSDVSDFVTIQKNDQVKENSEI